MTQRFPAESRIRKTREFQRVYGGRDFAADAVLVINGRRNGLGRSRLGLSVSRKVGNAVQRNRWKRQLREAFRTQQNRLPQGWDLVVRPRRGAELDSRRIRESLRRLSHRMARSGKQKPRRPEE